MPKSIMEGARSTSTALRNTLRWGVRGFPGIQKKSIRKMARKGLAPKVVTDLNGRVTDFTKWVGRGGTGKAPKIRVTADKLLTNTKGAVQSFVGIGLDEHVATRLQSSGNNWTGISSSELKDISGARSRTADLVWKTGDSNEPIAGHTPGIKKALVGGTLGAITKGHGTRDTQREDAVDTTFRDKSSPHVGSDTALMGTLATIKYMSSPGEELGTVKGDLQKLGAPRYSALTGNKDLRIGANFDEMVAHIQEERERKKWEAAAAMKGDSRLSPLVPPTINSYLGTYGNDPQRSMEAFRYDTHKSWFFGPNVNRSPTSDTEDLRIDSLNKMAGDMKVGTRRRALSDARELPMQRPINARGVD